MGVCCAILLVLGLLVIWPGFKHFLTSVKDPKGSVTFFRGLEELYGKGTDTVKLLTVHGMGNHPAGYSRELTDGLAERLGILLVKQDPDELLEVGIPGPNPPRATLRRLCYASATRRLEVFEVTWAPLVHDLKKHLLLDFDAAHRGERALVNGALKASLIDENLSDPVLYLGASGSYMRSAVKQSLCRLLNATMNPPGTDGCQEPSLEANAVVAMVTFSLGSAITFDAVEELEQQQSGPGSAAHALLGSTARVFMLANQLPLLALAAAQPGQAGAAGSAHALASSAAAKPQTSLAKILRIRESIAVEHIKESAKALEVVTISDPNDLLSYPLPVWLADQFPAARLVNVTTIIAQRFLAGTVANPMQAHTGHLRSRKVMKMLVDGAGSGH
jgi:hypothetical protein